ncbi:Ninja-family protein AFP3 [Platanthera guangdongensis]|uniref:Ninja-family protein n=1 Tax=Platanthera guangdongensis TaxID=2320717 RepID=A0ABR2M4V8_9ASPA
MSVIVRRGSGRIATEKTALLSTRGDGRNGRKIQGFLYKCGWGEVRIVYVCHGSFLMPAEFVKHGGGGDVAHPLKHIIANPSSPPFL